MNKTDGYVVLAFVVVAIVVIVFVLLIGGKSNKEAPKCSPVKILRIGGCDSAGRCGVIFENGVVDQVFYPVQGAAYNICL